jgi:hypothetical protein
MCSECSRCGRQTSARIGPVVCTECQTKQDVCVELANIRLKKAEKETELFHLEALEKALVNQIWSINAREREKRWEVK